MQYTTRQVQRTPYMQSIMTLTYPGVAIEALKNGFEGSWERLIAVKLKIDCRAQHSEALEIVGSIEDETDASKCFLRAAYLITNSRIQDHDPDDLKNVRFGQ